MKLQLILSLKKSSREVILPVTFEGSASENGLLTSTFSVDSDIAGKAIVVAVKGGGAVVYDLARPINDDLSVWTKDGDDRPKPPKCTATMLMGAKIDAVRQQCWSESFQTWSIMADTHSVNDVVNVLNTIEGGTK